MWKCGLFPISVNFHGEHSDQLMINPDILVMIQAGASETGGVRLWHFQGPMSWGASGSKPKSQIFTFKEVNFPMLAEMSQNIP